MGLKCPNCKCQKFKVTNEYFAYVEETIEIDANGTVLTEYKCTNCQWKGVREELVK